MPCFFVVFFWCCSEKNAEDIDQADTSISDQQPPVTKAVHGDEVGSEEDGADSDLGTLSQASTDKDATDGSRETPTELDSSATQEERRKAAEEKVCVSL